MASVGTLGEGWRRRRRRPRPCWGEADAAPESDARSRAGGGGAAAASLPIAAPAGREGRWGSGEVGGWDAISSGGGGSSSDRGCWSEERQHGRGRGREQARPPRRRLSSLLLSLPLLLALGLLPQGAKAFNILPHVPSFRHHLFFHPATPAPSEGGPRGPPTSNHLSPTGGDSGSASGEEHPLHAGAGTLVDVARRRFWRWTVWRRLYHSSVVTVLKQAAPPALPSFAPRRPRLESTYTKPTPFQFNEPDAGPVAVASTAGYNSVHLVTRAAAPEQKSLIYVNGTEVSGHLRSAVSIPSPPPFPSAADDAATPTAGQSLSLSLLGEFCVDKPAYLHIAPTRAGSTPLLWVTQFSLTRKGSVSGISIFGGPQPRSGTKPPPPPPPSQAAVPPAPAPPSSWSPSPPVEMRLGSSFRWPNEVYNLPPGTVAGAAEEALLVADGFLMPGRSDGGLYVVQDPGKPSERVTALTRHRPGWFYHKAAWVDLMGEGGRPCLLTARATKPFFAQTEGELVLLLQPEGPFPLAEWNTPWREVVLAKGPDVMFEVADLDPEDETLEVFAAEFFSRRLTLHRVRKGDHRTGRLPRVLTSEVLDDTLGPAYSVVLADLKGDGNGRPSHVLVSSHECQYEGLAGAEDLAAAGRGGFGAGGGGETLPGLAAAAALSGVEERPRGPGLQGSSSSSSSAAASSSSSPSTAAAALDPELKGGSLFAYAIPKNWRKRVPWRRSVVATGFHVRTWGQINPGAPGFPYVFYPHAAMQGQKGQRPYILLAGDCSHAAYIYRPVPPVVEGQEEEDGEVRYEPMAQINCGGTVGSLAVGYLPLFGQEEGGDESRGGAAGAGGGWAKIFVPNFDTDKVYAFSFGPERGMHVSPGLEPPSVPSAEHRQKEAERQARLAEEDEAVAALNSYGRARGEKTKIS